MLKYITLFAVLGAAVLAQENSIRGASILDDLLQEMQECQDDNAAIKAQGHFENCAAVKDQCNHENAVYRHYARQYCPVTCGACGSGGDSTSPSECKDDDAGLLKGTKGIVVKSHKKHNYVNSCARMVEVCRDPQMGPTMKSYCPKTCGVCGDGGGCSDNDGGIKADSRGFVSTCGEAKKYCTHAQFKGPVIKNCPKTCGACGCSDNDAGIKAESGGFVSTCKEAQQYCTHKQFKGPVTKNCPKTCGLCGSQGHSMPVLLRGKASQSSEGWSGRPSRAVDGNTDQKYSRSSCTHTQNGGRPWWKLDFGSSKMVSKVQVWNRADCCSSRLNKVQVKVGSSVCGSLSSTTSVQTITCNKKGSAVVLQQTRSDYLTLCEVKVYGSASTGLSSGAKKDTKKGMWTLKLKGSSYSHSWKTSVLAGSSGTKWSISSRKSTHAHCGKWGIANELILLRDGAYAKTLSCQNQKISIISKSFKPVPGTQPLTKAPIPGIKYVGSLSNPKAHPYVYPSRSSAAAACRKSGYKGLCSRKQVDGFQVCGAGWMTNYKGYWMSKTVRGCGSGRGFRSWGAGSVGAYCCDAIKYIGSLTNPKAHPYVYPSRSSATKACHKSGYAGLCSKAMVDGYEKCAAGWMTDYKGYWMSKTVRGCGSGRGMRGWGAGNVGAYCCTTK